MADSRCYKHFGFGDASFYPDLDIQPYIYRVERDQVNAESSKGHPIGLVVLLVLFVPKNQNQQDAHD